MRQAVGDEWELTPYRGDEPLEPQLNSANLAIICPNSPARELHRLLDLLSKLDASAAWGILMLPDSDGAARGLASRYDERFFCVRTDTPAAELAAKFSTLSALQSKIQTLQAELAAAKKAGPPPAETYADLDEEMRLAARLQRDFLPHHLPEVGPVRFGVLYRPVSWVSGDIYDVVRLDETHVGFYLADAVGHGMPAALMTIFIKKALQTKRIIGDTYEIIPPEVSLARLNTDICEQNLSNYQFCTAVYCVLNTATLTLTYARAGHPEPLLIHADGTIETLPAQGSLLGVFPEETYQSEKITLSRGDRLLLYTDGLESALRKTLGDGNLQLKDVIAPWAGMDRNDMLQQLTAKIDAEGSAPDDIIVMIVDIEK